VSSRSPTSMIGARLEKGAVLAASLMLLLAMTVLALAASEATRTQSEVATGLRDRDVAFESAEGALRAGERVARTMADDTTACQVGRCRVYEAGSLDDRLTARSSEWWRTHGWPHTPPASTSGSNEVTAKQRSPATPYYAIEEHAETHDSLAVSPSGPPPGRMTYRVTAVVANEAGDAAVVLQSTTALRRD
jgi:type IV pilus assembly protein PilX